MHGPHSESGVESCMVSVRSALGVASEPPVDESRMIVLRGTDVVGHVEDAGAVSRASSCSGRRSLLAIEVSSHAATSWVP